MVLAIKNMGGESEAAWRELLDDLTARGMTKPELVIVDGGKGLEAALASLWDDVPVQRCTVHKERNLLAHAPKKLHEEIKADLTTDACQDGGRGRSQAQGIPGQVEASLSSGGGQPGGGGRTAVHLPALPARTMAIAADHECHERLHEEFKRRIKTQCLLPCAETAAMLFWALLASGQITLRESMAGRASTTHRPT